MRNAVIIRLQNPNYPVEFPSCREKIKVDLHFDCKLRKLTKSVKALRKIDFARKIVICNNCMNVDN